MYNQEALQISSKTCISNWKFHFQNKPATPPFPKLLLHFFDLKLKKPCMFLQLRNNIQVLRKSIRSMHALIFNLEQEALHFKGRHTSSRSLHVLKSILEQRSACKKPAFHNFQNLGSTNWICALHFKFKWVTLFKI
jgi:hypothetical protein